MKVRNTFIIFIVSGFWHGANWTFIIWGALNALYFLPLLLRKKNRSNIDTVAEKNMFPSIKEFSHLVLTFILTCFAWIFFRSDTIQAAFAYIGKIMSFDIQFDRLGIERQSPEILPLILVLILMEWFSRNREFPSANSKSIWITIFLILMILVFGSFSSIKEFIYFQF